MMPGHGGPASALIAVFTAIFAIDDWSEFVWASGQDAQFAYPKDLS